MKCLIHPECKATVKINNVDICYECWNKANTKERSWYNKTIDMYNRGLLTKQELEDNLSMIGFHEVDHTFPVHL